jgi:hypothetical protein
VTETGHHGQSADLRSDAIALAAALVLIAGAVVTLHGPAVSLSLTGDSYQWIQHAHAAAHRPTLLLSDLDTFYRPSTTWTLVVDRMLRGGFEADGYRTSSLALHGIVALLLVGAGRRLGLGPVAAAVVGLVWAASPFTDESAFVVAYRFQPLLLAAWLVLVAAWPRRGERWTRPRLGLAILAVIAAAAAKETWVVTPALVAALEVDRRRSIRDALPTVAAVTVAAAAYVAAYFVAFPTSKSYYEFGPHVVAKIPQQLAAFLYLDEPMPFALTLSWAGVLAVVVCVALVASAIRWRIRGAWVAIALLVLPTLPTLPVPYMPQRYLAIPYAGFLLLVALWVDTLRRRTPRWNRLTGGLGGLVAVLVTVAGGALVRADLEDYRAMAAAHGRLLDEARQVTDTVTVGQPVLVVRDEASQPLVEILRDPRGLPKLPYTRQDDPYGLVDTAALFEWVLADEGTRVERIDDWATRLDGVSGRVLVHRAGGFDSRGSVADLAGEASRWQEAGRRVRVIRPVALD